MAVGSVVRRWLPIWSRSSEKALPCLWINKVKAAQACWLVLYSLKSHLKAVFDVGYCQEGCACMKAGQGSTNSLARAPAETSIT